MENDNPIRPATPAPDAEVIADPLLAPDNTDDLSEDTDADDAIHSAPDKPSEENLQQDADDAIHKSYKPAPDPSHENEERDPDDLIHGK